MSKKAKTTGKAPAKRPTRDELMMRSVGVTIARFIQSGYLSAKMAQMFATNLDVEYVTQLRTHNYPLPPLVKGEPTPPAPVPTPTTETPSNG